MRVCVCLSVQASREMDSLKGPRCLSEPEPSKPAFNPHRRGRTQELILPPSRPAQHLRSIQGKPLLLRRDPRGRPQKNNTHAQKRNPWAALCFFFFCCFCARLQYSFSKTLLREAKTKKASVDESWQTAQISYMTLLYHSKFASPPTPPPPPRVSCFSFPNPPPLDVHTTFY